MSRSNAKLTAGTNVRQPNSFSLRWPPTKIQLNASQEAQNPQTHQTRRHHHQRRPSPKTQSPSIAPIADQPQRYPARRQQHHRQHRDAQVRTTEPRQIVRGVPVWRARHADQCVSRQADHHVLVAAVADVVVAVVIVVHAAVWRWRRRRRCVYQTGGPDENV